MLKLLKDPLLHFAALGLVLFAAYLSVDSTRQGGSEVVITAAQQRQTAAAFARVWGREPSSEELKALLDDWLREELANREARSMGLALNDVVIRRRLRQKYESAMEQMAASVTPSEEALHSWYENNEASYRRDPEFAFRHLFFSADRRRNPFDDAVQVLATLKGQAPAEVAGLGDVIALPAAFDLTARSELANRFGTIFAEALGEQGLRQWDGPLESAYGYHLVYLEQAIPARLPEFATVRATVLRDWRSAHLDRAQDALYDELLQRYSVRFEQPSQADGR
ncbi:MAG: peptidylprolyl isomerase [Pseudomonadota bacterium]